MSTKKMRTAALTALAVPALIGSVMAAPAPAEAALKAVPSLTAVGACLGSVTLARIR